MEKLLTTKDLAEAIGSSESSLRRWTNSGAIRTARTVGGHRRIALSEAIRFVRATGATVVRPDVLGLPETPSTATGEPLGGRSLERQLHDSLVAGNAAGAKGCVSSLYLGGMSVAAICDGPIRSAMERIGELWRHDVQGILIEHRATTICIQILELLRQMVAPAPATAPLAIGGAPEGDPYLLPSNMVSAVMAEAGCRDMNFGPQTPLDLLAAAARDQGASMVWLSLSTDADSAKLSRSVKDLAEELSALNASLLVGGAKVESLGIRPSGHVHVMRTMAELAAFARGSAKGTEAPGRSARPAD